MDKTFEQQFLKDIVDEKSFLDAVGKVNQKGLLSELDAMKIVYNEVLDGFIKNRFDVEIFRVMAEVDPEGGVTTESPVNNGQKFKNAKQSLKNRHITIEVCRKQVLMYLGKYANKQNKGKTGNIKNTDKVGNGNKAGRNN